MLQRAPIYSTKKGKSFGAEEKLDTGAQKSVENALFKGCFMDGWMDDDAAYLGFVKRLWFGCLLRCSSSSTEER